MCIRDSWNAATKSLDLEGYLNAIKDAPKGSVFVLHACAHNPTGLDPSKEQWVDILDALVKGDHIVLFDSAYQGFASGNLDNDAYAVRLGLEKLATVSPVLICQSFAKNVGMYGERVGCFHLVLPQQDSSVDFEHQAQVTSIQYAFRATGSTLGVSLAGLIYQASLQYKLYRDILGDQTLLGKYGQDQLRKWCKEILQDNSFDTSFDQRLAKEVHRGFQFSSECALGFALAACTLGVVLSCFMREHVLGKTVPSK